MMTVFFTWLEELDPLGDNQLPKSLAVGGFPLEGCPMYKGWSSATVAGISG